MGTITKSNEEKLTEMRLTPSSWMESDLGYKGDCYKTTYSAGAAEDRKKRTNGGGAGGAEPDSDEDPYHITMPFRRSDEMRKRMFEDPVFESDEEYE